MCGRYRLTRRRLLEIENYYGVDDVNDLDIWERQFNIPPREMAPIILRRFSEATLYCAGRSVLRMCGTKKQETTPAHISKGRAVSVNGGTIQLLETNGIRGAPDSDLRDCNH